MLTSLVLGYSFVRFCSERTWCIVFPVESEFGMVSGCEPGGRGRMVYRRGSDNSLESGGRRHVVTTEVPTFDAYVVAPIVCESVYFVGISGEYRDCLTKYVVFVQYMHYSSCIIDVNGNHSLSQEM